MRTFDLGEVIAERTLQFVAKAGWTRDVTIRIGRPVRDQEQKRAWVCPFQVQGLDYEDVVGILGGDAMQALLLGIHTIPGQLAGYVRRNPGVFTHLGQPDTSFADSCRTVLEYAADVFPPRQE